MPTHIVDACAVIAYFKGENGHEQFASILEDEGSALAIHATNLCEVYYAYLRSDGLERAEEAWERALQILGVIDTFSFQFMKRVARWKFEHGLSLGDSFAAATAEEHACPLVTADHGDFDALESGGALTIEWLR